MSAKTVLLPVGTVTFLFTDIEGSSSQWESDPVAMRARLARHDEIVRDAIESWGGVVFKHLGDGFGAAFGSAPDAVAAAGAARLASARGSGRRARRRGCAWVCTAGRRHRPAGIISGRR